ncbi:LuxE family acyl-protein synthetase [Parashewanella tropica]|uniref:LuxE/PaaK family acyltransferase n=1 Tax=Parashewanella tropica TaxID=2547970 RepID=UPI00105A955D|nr:LuxE family acyl-protein synthetase [Parashewanella tropica]
MELNSLLKNSGLDPVKVALSSTKQLYAMSDNNLLEFKSSLVIDSFKFHFENNAFYRSACEEKNISPEVIKSSLDLIKIPLIPIQLFKANDNHKLLSKNLKDVELEMRSTGTSGIPSVSRRCSETVDNATLGIYAMYREFFSVSKGAGLYLCPSNEEIPEMGMIKALNMMAGLLDTHRFMVKSDSFAPEDALEQLSIWENNFDRHIIGPPFLINRFIRFLKATNQKLKLDKNTLVITLGGWKRFSGEMLSRKEFNNECIEYFGIEQHQIRDIYALVESNVVAIDDEHGIKHVSPYIHFSVRDPKNLDKEVATNEVGQLAILDPLSRSTPGFILTEDLVRLLPKADNDLRSGQRVEYVMRLPESTEFGCCAVNLDKQLDDIEEQRTHSCPVIA